MAQLYASPNNLRNHLHGRGSNRDRLDRFLDERRDRRHLYRNNDRNEREREDARHAGLAQPPREVRQPMFRDYMQTLTTNLDSISNQLQALDLLAMLAAIEQEENDPFCAMMIAQHGNTPHAPIAMIAQSEPHLLTVDSGATDHIFNTYSIFDPDTVQPCSIPITTAGTTKIMAEAKGDVTANITLPSPAHPVARATRGTKRPPFDAGGYERFDSESDSDDDDDMLMVFGELATKDAHRNRRAHIQGAYHSAR